MVTCPSCETSYNPQRLGIKIGPKDQSIMWCKICGAQLLVKGREIELTGDPPPRTWRNLWRRQQAPVFKVTRYLVELVDGT